MVFEYECIKCGKKFSKDTLVRCNNQKYCPECRAQMDKARNHDAWKARREREKRKLMERHDGRQYSRAVL